MVVELDLQATQAIVPDSLEAVLRSLVKAVEARCGAITLVKAEDCSLCPGPSCGPLPSLESAMSAARWVTTKGEPLALESRWQASQVPGLVIDTEDVFPLLCVPVQGQGKTLGALQVNLPLLADGKGIPQKLDVLKLAASYIGCLLENDRLQQELEKKEMHLIRLVKDTIDAQEVERERLCMEVHDGVAQTLASAFQYLQALENSLPSRETQVKHMVSRSAALVRQAIHEARGIISSLTPAALGELGLVRILGQELKQFEKETGCRIEFEADWPRLAEGMEIALYRIIREAVTNVRKHANSQKMRIELRCLPDRLVAVVRDWGAGFDPGQQTPISGRHSAGLFSMRKRAQLLGGTCQVHSAPGQGTEVEVEVPIAKWGGRHGTDKSADRG